MQGNCCCYNLVIRQITCQNGVRNNIENIYTNIQLNSLFSLYFGYTIKKKKKTTSDVSIKLRNDNYIPPIIFTIPVNTFKIFNVPKESGTLIIYIGLKRCDSNNITSVACC